MCDYYSSGRVAFLRNLAWSRSHWRYCLRELTFSPARLVGSARIPPQRTVAVTHHNNPEQDCCHGHRNIRKRSYSKEGDWDVHGALTGGIDPVFDDVVVELPITFFNQSKGFPVAEPPEAATN